MHMQRKKEKKSKKSTAPGGKEKDVKGMDGPRREKPCQGGSELKEHKARRTESRSNGKVLRVDVQGG